MKKSLSIILILVMILSLSACGAKPETVVEKYFAAAKAFDPEGMQALVDAGNEEAVNTIAEYTGKSEDEYTKYFLNYLKENAGKMTYHITGSQVNGDAAVVTVECKYIDGSPVLQATISEAFTKMLSLAFSGTEMTEEKTNQIFLDIMKEQTEGIGENYKEVTIEVNCVKENGTWYIADLNDDLLDVITSGFFSAAAELNKAFGSGEEEPSLKESAE